MRRKRNAGPVEPLDNGTYSLRLSPNERETLLGFVTQLEDVISSPPDDPRVTRLFPVAYHQDAEMNDEYQQFMRDELVQSRLAATQTVRTILSDDSPMTEGQLYAFMTVLNSLRLVLGTLLDVSEDDDGDDLDDDDPAFGQAQLYGYLGWLLEWVVWALSGDER